MILIADDDIAVVTSLNFLLSQNGYKTDSANSPEDIISKIRRNTYELVLLDMNYSINTTGDEGIELLRKIKVLKPELPVILITGWGTISLAVEGIKYGAFDFITKPWSNTMLLKSVVNASELNRRNVNISISEGRKQLDECYNFSNIIGESPELLKVLKTIGKVASTTASVLITGDSGTGKELIAEAIHNNSSRKDQPFVKVNLGAIPDQLFESEMFGYMKGAFTDAKSDKKGRFQIADKGTIFLDEIGELSMSNQVKLLRVLQEQTFEPLGSDTTHEVDVRVICATNKNLPEMIDRGDFREDLFYRINLIQIRNPELSERRGDISLLAKYFLHKISSEQNLGEMTFSRSAYHWLKHRDYKGNIRELKNLIERTAIISENSTIDKEELDLINSGAVTSVKKPLLVDNEKLMTIDEMEKQLITTTLEKYKWNISKTASSLGLSRAALYRRFEKHGIKYEV